MPAHSETLISLYTPRQLFSLVADVEAYPEFLPWCRAARILERGENAFTAELVIGFKAFTGSYVSRVMLSNPAGEHEPCAISVTLVRGPFERLSNEWKFSPHESGTRIDFTLDFAFNSFLLNRMIGPLFSRAIATMVTAFEARANALYGKERKA